MWVMALCGGYDPRVGVSWQLWYTAVSSPHKGFTTSFFVLVVNKRDITYFQLKTMFDFNRN